MCHTGKLASKSTILELMQWSNEQTINPTNPEQENKNINHFFKIVEVVSLNSTCLRRKIGAILVKDKHIISTGYNGAPVGLDHCEVCLRKQLNIPSGERHELCRAVHAEQNAIIQTAYHGIATKDSDMFTHYYPCSICIKMIINSGIKTVFYLSEYNDDLAKQIVKESHLKLIRIRVL